MIKISYIVKMKFYQYNTGMGNNGYRYVKKEFNKEEEAWDFWADVKLMQLNRNFPIHWAWDYVDDGFLELMMGVYKVVHEEIPLFETNNYKDPDYIEMDIFDE